MAQFAIDEILTTGIAISGFVFDVSNNIGTNGYVLTSTSSGVMWQQDSSNADLSALSGQIAATGSLLNNRINSLSGYANNTFLSGVGVSNYVPRWSGTKLLVTGSIFDLGTGVGIGTTDPVALLTVGSTTTTSSEITLQGQYQSSVFNNANIFNFRHGGFNRWRLLTTQNSAASNDFDFSINAINATVNAYNAFLTIKGLNGNVGISTTNPTTLLSVGGAGSTTAASGLTFGGDAQANLYRSAEDTIKTDGSLVVAANATFAGNVGIGLTNPAVKLDVSGGNARFSDYIIVGEDLAYPSNTGSAYLGYSTSPASSPQSNLELIDALSNAIGVNDPLRFRNVISGQYFSGSNWYADPAPLFYGTLLNGNATSYLDIVTSSEYSVGISGKRFVVDQGTTYTRPNFILLNTDWNQNFWGFKLNVENSNDLVNWTNCITEQTFTTNNTRGAIALNINGSIQSGGISRYFRFSFVANQAITAGSLRVNKIRSLGNQNYSSTIPVSTSAAGNLIASVGIISPTITSLSGNLAATGSVLDTKINTLSGYSNSTFATITNLATTGSVLNAKINSLSGYITTGAVENNRIYRECGLANLPLSTSGWYKIAQYEQLNSDFIYDLMYGEISYVYGDNQQSGNALVNFNAYFRQLNNLASGQPFATYSYEIRTSETFKSFEPFRIVKTIDTGVGPKTYELQVSPIGNNYGLISWDIKYTSTSANSRPTVYGTEQVAGNIINDPRVLRFGNKIFTDEVGIGIFDPLSLLSVGGAGSTSATSGITFGADSQANLYRISSSRIKTDGNFTIDGQGGGATSLVLNRSSTSSENGMAFTTAGSTDWYFYVNDSSNNLQIQRSSEIDSAPRVRFDGANSNILFNLGGGNVGIGITNPTSKLYISGGTIDLYGRATYINADITTNTSAYTHTLNLIDSTNDSNATSFALGSYSHAVLRNRAEAAGGAGGILDIYTRVISGAPTVKMTITSDGKVGIGSTNPAQKLDVNGSIYINNNASYLYGKTTGSAATRMVGINSVNDLYIGSVDQAVSNIRINNNGSDRVLIDSLGNVGIGTTLPSSKLSVSGSIESLNDNGGEGGQLILRGNTYRYNIDNYLGQGLRFFREDDATTANGLVLMQISSGGNVGINNSSPGSLLDIRFPTNPATDNGAGNNVLRLWTSATANTDVGGAIGLGGQYSGGLFQSFGQIAGRKSNATLGNNAGYLQFATTNNGGTMNEWMRIDAGGSVGIGTNNPFTKLHVYAASNGNNWAWFAGNVGATVPSQFTYGLLLGTNYSNGFSESNLVWGHGISSNQYFAIGKASGNASYTEQLRIDSLGNVGIGTSIPSTPLHVFSTTNTLATFTRDLATDASFTIGADNNGTVLGTLGVHAIQIYTNATERMRIASNGNVGIGTNVTPLKLNVSGSIYMAAGSGSAISWANDISSQFLKYDSVTDGMVLSSWSHTTFLTQQTERVRISSNGRVGIGFTIPTESLDVSGRIRGIGETFVLNAATLTDSQTSIALSRLGAVTDQKYWEILSYNAAANGDFAIRAINDAYSAAAEGLRFVRGGSYNISSVLLPNGNIGIGTATLNSFINSNTIYFRPNPSGKFLNIYSSNNESIVNLISNNSGDGSGIGGIYFTRSRGQTDAHLQVAAIKAIQGGTNGTLAGGRLYFYTKSNGGGTLETDPAMIIDTAGNIGIGTTVPSSKLTIYDHTNGATVNLVGRGTDDTAVINFRTSGDLSTYAYVAPDTNEFRLYHNDGFMSLYPGGSEKVRFTAAGNVGIGVTNPGVRLQVTNTGSITSTSTIRIVGATGNGAGSQIEFFKGTSQKFSIGTASAITGGLSDDLLLTTLNPSSIILTAGLSGLAIFKTDGKVGIGMYDPVSLLSVGGAGSTSAASGLTFGQDAQANLYRSAEDTIKTDGSLIINGNLNTNLATVSALNINAGTLGASPVNIALTGFTYAVNNGNISQITFVEKRFATGGDWTTATTRIQKRVDVTDQAYIEFNPSGALYGMALGVAAGGSLEAMRILSNGSIGIGTISPSQRLDVIGTIRANGELISEGNNARISLFKNNGINHFDWSSGQSLYFSTQTSVTGGGRSTLLAVTSGGNVGIGTLTPNGKLHVVSPDSAYAFSVAGATKGVRFNINSAGTFIQGVDNTLAGSYQSLILGGSDLYFQTNGVTNAMYIDSNGDVGINNTSPSSKLHVVETTPTGTRIQLGTNTENASMNAGLTNDLLILNAPYGTNSATVSNSGAKWGIKFIGTLEANQFNSTRKTSAIYAVSEDPTAGYNRGTSLAFYTNAWFDQEYTERMRIFQNGNIGIGTTQPSYKLQIVGSGTPTSPTVLQVAGLNDAGGDAKLIISQSPVASDLQLLVAGTDARSDGLNANDQYILAGQQLNLFNRGNGSTYNTQIMIGRDGGYGNISFSTAPQNQTAVVRMYIASGGNVGIGSISPACKLDVAGTIRSSSSEIYGFGASDNVSLRAASSLNVLGIYTSNVERLRLAANGYFGIGTDNPSTLLSIGRAGSTTAASGITFGEDAQANLYRTAEDTLRTDGALIAGTYLRALNYVQLLTNLFPDSYTDYLKLNVGNAAGNAWENYPVVIKRGVYVGIGTDAPSGKLHVVSTVAGETVLRADGTNGTLFSVTDDLSDSLMSVNNSAGLPVLEVFADDRVVAGQYGSGDFVIRNNKVGIGATNPLNKLSVIGSAGIGSDSYNVAAPTNGLIIEGNVGIGTTNPVGKLSVVQSNNYSSFRSNSAGAYTYLSIGRTASEFEVGVAGGFNQFFIGTAAGESVIKSLAGKMHLGYASNTPAITINTSNYVGIGTTNPVWPLDVSGNAIRSFATGAVEPGFIADYASSNGYGGFFVHTNGVRKWRIAVVGDTDTSPALSIWQEGVGSRMHFRNNGAVGVGTTIPDTKLSIGVASDSALGSTSDGLKITDGTRNVQLLRNGTGYNYAGVVGSGSMLYSYDRMYIVADTSNPILFHAGGGERARIQSNGNVGIGITNPSYKLDVNGTFRTATNNLTLFNDYIYVSPTNNNTLNAAYNVNGIADMWINFRGYNDGQTQFRNFNVGDGKGANIAWFDGTNRRISINNGQSASYTLDVNGNGRFGDRVGIGTVNNSFLLTVGSDGSTTSASGIALGNDSVANLYRSATSTIKTDGNLIVVGNVTAANLVSGSGTTNYITKWNGTKSVTNSQIFDDGTYVGINTISNTTYRLQVNGSFAATTKSFDIVHPTISGKRLVYASLEGPENGVYFRGKNNNNEIILPHYWSGLVHDDSITVNLTSIGKRKDGKIRNYSVGQIGHNKVYIYTDSDDNIYDYYYTIFAERKDVSKLVIERDME